MSEGTTKPSGSREEMKTVEESQKKIMEKIEASGHEWFLTCMESSFSNVTELSDAYKNNNSSNNSDTSNTGGDSKKINEFVITGANGKLSFEYMIPHIAVGAIAHLKTKKDKAINTKSGKSSKIENQKGIDEK